MYDVQVFRRETMIRQKQSGDETFWDDKSNLEPFTAAQKQQLQERLLQYGYFITSLQNDVVHFEHRDGLSISAMLTGSGLYFSTVWNEAGIFEIGMTASEFTDTDEFVKYDPQQEGWEEL